jgi:hypothetical protein
MTSSGGSSQSGINVLFLTFCRTHRGLEVEIERITKSDGRSALLTEGLSTGDFDRSLSLPITFVRSDRCRTAAIAATVRLVMPVWEQTQTSRRADPLSTVFTEYASLSSVFREPEFPLVPEVGRGSFGR